MAFIVDHFQTAKTALWLMTEAHGCICGKRLLGGTECVSFKHCADNSMETFLQSAL